MGAFKNLKEFQRPIATIELLQSVTTPEKCTNLLPGKEVSSGHATMVY